MLSNQEGMKMVPSNCRVIIPTAPIKKVSVQNGQETTSWFDVYTLGYSDKIDYNNIPLDHARKSSFSQDDLAATSDLIIKMIEEERLKFEDQSSQRIFIGGFSQGCIVSIATLIRYAKLGKKLGGVLGLSGMHALADFNVSDEQAKLIGETPLFTYHGEKDDLLYPTLVKRTYQELSERCYTGENKQNYQQVNDEKLAHSLNANEIFMISK